MKYTCEVEIKLPMEETARLWDDEHYFKEWQDGFKKIELLKGPKGAAGSQSLLIYEQGKHRILLTETIIDSHLPKEKFARYEHVHMTNTQNTKFVQVTEHITKIISEVEYTRFNGLPVKLMAWLFPGMFKKQSQKWLNQFKKFAEKNIPLLGKKESSAPFPLGASCK
jgi:hypothetical protein